jgi:hypothetical protein
MVTMRKTTLALALALTSAACNGHLTRNGAKSQLEAVVKAEQKGPAQSPRLLISTGTVSGTCYGIADSDLVKFSGEMSVMSSAGYITTRQVKKNVWDVELTQLGQQALDGPKYGHKQETDCDEWQVDFPLSKYDHLDVTGIVEDGLHAKVDASLTFVITPVGAAVRKVASSVVLDTLTKESNAEVEEVLEKTSQRVGLSASKREQMRTEMRATEEKRVKDGLNDKIQSLIGDDLFYTPPEAKTYVKKRTFEFEKYDDGWRVSSPDRPEKRQ